MSEIKKIGVSFVTVTDDHLYQRVDNFLFNHLKNLPKTRVYRLIRKGEIRVNKKRVDASYKLQLGDLIRIPPMMLEEVKLHIPGRRSIQMLTDRVLYEDDNLLIINKPSGIPVHGGTGVKVGVIETLKTLYPKLPQLELAHRLDADTSGCLVLAKKRSRLRELHALLRAGQVHKVYLALTKGHWRTDDLKVTAPLTKNFLQSGERMVRVDPNGKASATTFAIEQAFEHATLVQATLHTGRTHQIRVHSRHKGHPIAGDEKYGDLAFNKDLKQIGLNRLFLHAHTISFTLPSSGLQIQVTAPLEEDLKACLTSLKLL